MSKGRKTPPKGRQRKKPSPCKCIRDGTPAHLSDLVASSARVLLKFTEGAEDWDEWIDVRNALMMAAKHADKGSRTYALSAINDFDQRRRDAHP